MLSAVGTFARSLLPGTLIGNIQDERAITGTTAPDTSGALQAAAARPPGPVGLIADALDANALVSAMHGATARWHAEPPADGNTNHILALHHANFMLWHLEDDARNPAATAEEVAGVKRSIDRVNQTRNDFAEAVDVQLLQVLQQAGLPQPTAPLHSETPGQILDRLSILSLKRFHTEEETHRQTASEAHRMRNLERLAILHEQSRDLTDCLQDLWVAILRGERRFKQYRQFKMYNDPELNPVLYRAGYRR